jgi:hypothetical protein
MIIAFDYHDTITAAPDLCELIMSSDCVKEIHVITGTPNSRLNRVEDGLRKLGLFEYVTKVWGAFEYEPGTRTQVVLSDNELTKECSINTTANLQVGQFDHVNRS